ncbi:MAG: bifunctional precorrin-2 dehydrogenase/sirohydrochlorin ferrochelatase [Acidobacteriota bacterium]|nr:bifunctional precorrin-2 dehydrogenase/sirohydrochlorin ferrochelatase [Acidobacteriota bacterium]
MSDAAHYVACLDLTGRRCLVVGSGAMAREKAEALRASGAEVEVSAAYEPALLDGVWLVVCADPALGERVFADAEERRIFCNVADVPRLCSFILPALHRRGPITVAVSTAGASPALAQRLRDDFAARVGPEHERLAAELRALRPWAKANLATYADRRDFFRRRVEEALDRRRLDGAGQGAEVPAWRVPERR